MTVHGTGPKSAGQAGVGPELGVELKQNGRSRQGSRQSARDPSSAGHPLRRSISLEEGSTGSLVAAVTRTVYGCRASFGMELSDGTFPSD
jgi:hypothetical protein